MLWADNLYVVRILGGWDITHPQGEQLTYGNTTQADLCYTNADGTLGYRWQLLAPRLAPYINLGYASATNFLSRFYRVLLGP